MAKKILKINAFQSGELSPDLDVRSDLTLYETGCEKLENIIVWNQGGITKRPGTKHVYSAGHTPQPAPTLVSGGPVISGSQHWTGDYTVCEGECLYTLSEGYGPYNLQTSPNESVWTTQETIPSGIFTWKCRSSICATSYLRIQDFDGNTSASILLDKQCETCAGGTTIDMSETHMDCSEVAYITLSGANDCCTYQLDIDSGGGSIEDGLVKTGRTTWTFTVPDPTSVSCCLDDYALFSLHCCEGGVLDTHNVDIGYPIPLLYSPGNPDTMDFSDSVEITVVDGKPPFHWTAPLNSVFSWTFSDTGGRTNTLNSTAAPDACDQSTQLYITDDCGSNTQGSMEINGSGAELGWDKDASVETIGRNTWGVVTISGGVSLYTWNISGTGFWFDADHTLTETTSVGGSIVIYTDNVACGPGTIDVEDACEGSATGYVRCTVGAWGAAVKGACAIPGTDGVIVAPGSSYHGCNLSKIEGKYYQHQTGGEIQVVDCGAVDCTTLGLQIDCLFKCSQLYYYGPMVECGYWCCAGYVPPTPLNCSSARCYGTSINSTYYQEWECP